MGHDTYARIGEEKIAYQRYNAGDNDARVLYRCLQLEEYDCGCSGNGDSIIIKVDVIERAIKNVTSDVYKRDLVNKNYLLIFLNKIVSEMRRQNKDIVTFDFW